MPPGFFFARNAPQTSPRGNRTRLLPRRRKNSRGMGRAESSTAGSASSKRFAPPAGFPLSRRVPQNFGGEIVLPKSEARRPQKQTRTPRCEARRPRMQTRPLPGQARPPDSCGNMQEPTPFTYANTPAAAQNTCRKRHPQGTSASFPAQKQASAASKKLL